MAKQPNPYLIDDENPELTDEQLASMRPFKEIFPEFATAMTRKQGERGKQKTPLKKPISIRLDEDVIEKFKALGSGWQSRINEVLKNANV